MLMQDFRYALRQLGKAPGFTATAVLVLALGIGVNAAMFTVVNSVLLQPLRYRDASRIVQFNTRESHSPNPFPRVTGGDYLDLRAQASNLEKIAYYDGGGVGEMGVQLGDHSTFTTVQHVSADFPQVFGIVPAAGRLFDDASVAHTALVSLPFARDNYGNAQAALGHTFNVEGKPYEIVGVVPAAAAFPMKTSVWLGMPPTPDSLERTAYNYRAVGKLKAGVSLATANSELSAISERLAKAYADNRGKTLSIKALREQIVGRVRPVLLLLLAAVAVVLLIVCVNVALLQLARAATQAKQTAVRTALGATRLRIIQQVAVQSLLLGIFGCVVGIFFAVPLIRILVRMAPLDLPRVADIHLDFFVVIVSFVASLVAMLLASVVPAWQASRVHPAEALKQDTSRGLGGRASTSFRNLLVVAEIALTFTLTVGAALLIRTLVQLSTTNLGFATSNVLVVYAHAPADGLDQQLEKVRTLDGAVAQIAAIPGVARASQIYGLPTTQDGSNGGYMVVGKGDPRDFSHTPEADFSLADPGYFNTMGIALVRGRDFDAHDLYAGEFVAIISQSLARQSFADEDPIGKQIICGLDSPKPMTIVGVVADVRQDSPAALPGATLYMPLAQHPTHATEVEIVVRTHVPPASLIDPVRTRLQSIDPTIATKFTTLDQSVGESIATQRFRTALLFGFALLALTLAALGVYGVMAYSVAQRRIDIGVRMALGAGRPLIVRMILSGALRLALIGIAAGALLSLLLLRTMQSMLAGVATSDVLSYAIAIVVLLSVAALAAYIPARRAASIDPIEALRSE